MELDYLIVGQGLAGTVLAYTLLKRGKKIAILDDAETPAASQVAAGIINPVTGRRLVKSWMVKELIEASKKFYQGVEAERNFSFFHEKTIVRIFESVREQNDFLAKTAEPNYQEYLKEGKDWPDVDRFKADFGYGFIQNAFQLNMPVFLSESKAFFEKESILIEGKINHEEINIVDDGVEVPEFNLKAERLIFCEGAKVSNNKFFKYLPFTPARGAFYLLEVEGLNPDFLIKKGLMLAPTNDPTIFWAGATYDHRNLNKQSTQKDRDFLDEKLEKLIDTPHTVLDVKSGVRPATKYRRPLIGVHHRHKQLGIFNGMGSKGVSLSPYFANHFIDFLEGKTELNEDVELEQYRK